MENKWKLGRISLRNDTTQNWNKNGDTVLYEGEVGVEWIESPQTGKSGTAKIKVGDGVTAWENLNYVGEEQTSEIYFTHYDFPNVGEQNKLYVDETNHKIYIWDDANHYICCGSDYNEINKIDCGGAEEEWQQ